MRIKPRSHELSIGLDFHDIYIKGDLISERMSQITILSAIQLKRICSAQNSDLAHLFGDGSKVKD